MRFDSPTQRLFEARRLLRCYLHPRNYRHFVISTLESECVVPAIKSLRSQEIPIPPPVVTELQAAALAAFRLGFETGARTAMTRPEPRPEKPFRTSRSPQ